MNVEYLAYEEKKSNFKLAFLTRTRSKLLLFMALMLFLLPNLSTTYPINMTTELRDFDS